MNEISVFWKFISNIGISNSEQMNDYQRVRLINQLLVLNLFCLGIAIPIYQQLNNPDMVIVSTVAFLMMAGGIVLSQLKKHDILQHYFIIANLGIVVFGTIMLNSWIHFYIFLFPLTVIVHYLYHQQTYYKYYVAVFLIILLVILVLIRPILDVASIEQYINNVLIIIAMIAQLAVLNFFTQETKAREKELLKKQQFIEEAQDIAKLGNWEYYIDQKLTKWSPKMYDILNLPKGHTPDFEMDILRNVSNYRPLIRHIICSEQTGKKFSFRFPHQMKVTKKWFRITGRLSFSEGHKSFKLSGTLQDVTESVQIEQQLAKSHSLLEATLEATVEGILVVDLDGHVLSYNQKFLDIWKIPTLVIDQRNDEILLQIAKNSVVNVGQFTEKVIELYKHPEYISIDLLELKDGRMLERYSQPQQLGGNIIGRVWSFRDVTEDLKSKQQIKGLLQEVRVQKEQLELQTLQLRQSNDELQRSNKELEQFAYVASHDLQEPLRMVGNFVGLLEEEYENELGEDGKLYIKFAVGGVTRMSKLIDNLLNYSRVGRREILIKNVNIKEVIQHKILDLRERIKEKNAVVLVDNDLPSLITCEQEQIGIVLYNLIGNALKFNINEKPKILIGGEEKEDHFQFFVMDNGIGIDEKYQERIFEVFKRLHRKEEFEGTGIGLSLCKRIIIRHGGNIWFESELGKGTTFYFTISKNIKND